MKYSREYIERLLGRFVEGLTTETEELTLAEYFETAEDIPAEWMDYKEMFSSFKTDDYDFSEEELDAMLTKDITIEPTPGLNAEHVPANHASRLWRWVVVAACASVLAIVAIRSWTTSDGDNTVAGKIVAEEQQRVVDDVEQKMNVGKTQEAEVNDLSAEEESGREDGTIEGDVVSEHTVKSGLVRKTSTVRKSNVVRKVDNIMASVTFPDEQVESYEIRKVGEANIVTKCYDDGTSASFIVACSDDGSSSQLIALN